MPISGGGYTLPTNNFAQPVPGNRVQATDGANTLNDIATALNTTVGGKVEKAGDTMTGLLGFSGTTHAGLRLNNLTTTERDAIASPQAGFAIWNTTAGRMQLYSGTGWTAGMVRLDGDTMTGALAIDTSGPSQILTRYSTDALGAAVQMRKARGTSASPSAVVSGDILMNNPIFAYDGAGFSSSGSFRFVADGPPGSGFVPGRFEVVTRDAGGINGLRFTVGAEGHITPGADNAYTNGSASFRWSIVYAGTGTINTSDENEKKWLGTLSPAEMRVARRLTQLIGTYQWNSAVAEKGSAARIHIGVTAQAVAAAFEAEGLDPASYAVWCRDEIFETVTEERDGEQISFSRPTGTYRQGVRYDQLYAFVTAAALAELQSISQRLAALEAA